MPLKKSPPSISSGWKACTLTWYDPALGGTNSASGAADPNSPTASGEPYSATAMTCAAPPAYAFGTLLKFAYGNRSVTVKVNDRGGAIQGDHFDMARAPATALGMINAGLVHARFQILSGTGNANPVASPSPSTSLAATATDAGGTVLGVAADALGLFLLEIIKDIGLGVADYIIVPAWHWNLRGIANYQQKLFDVKNNVYAMPATAAFWGLGYVLLFTDPDKPGLKPAPARRSRLARHARSLQSVPARKSLIKPEDVKEKTPKKPKPVTSSATVTSTGTMSTSRTIPVTVTGTHPNARRNDTPEAAAVPVERAGTLPIPPRNGSQKQSNAAGGESHARNRTGDSSQTDRGGNSSRGAK